MEQITDLAASLRDLKLSRLADHLESWLQDAAKGEWGYHEFLQRLVEEEMAAKKDKRTEMGTRMARLPFIKTLDSFDFSYQPSLDPKRIKDLSACRWVANGENVIFLGPPGVGKTHLSVGLGIEAIRRGYRTLFITAQGLITSLARAHTENRLDDKLKFFCQPKLLIIDEIGYIPIDRLGANLFFQLISRRYEKGAMIMTSNQPFSNWGDVFGDQIIASAILDRVLHHAISVSIKGESYRLKEKLKAGLLAKHVEQS
jgi:DNA replication protein DnaC